ncbi:MBOAT family protein [Asinibacterium sp. OR53]|uniref:MBOAT family O-acyltransferase n=1 Tax=Asinibacterium sp. OR53 TaxID=925409 RepID=UPI00047ABF42|nr:MBOAT family O-acyltransferase [Asinibacterium sp. OR53]
MLFNSIEFFLFFFLFFFLYWFVFNNDLRCQNLLLLLGSYLFYGWWDWRFLFLLMFSTGLDFLIGLKIDKTPKTASKKYLLWISIIINLSLLCFFKYCNFFITSFTNALDSINIHINPWILQIVLPVGISFYTFHGLSYVIDIYRGTCKPTKSLINYCVFVCYFPLLVSGPIERATHLLPQIEKPRLFRYDKALEGCRLILWGLFKKIVIADSLAPAVNDIFHNYNQYPGGVLALGAIYFSFQIYCDFSGYSDIARGTSKLLGIDLFLNFNFPYFSRSISDFWKRWHVSLSSWFRDYLYIPLGGSRTTRAKTIRNVLIVFILSGFWHGANLTFIIWGMMHAILFLPSFLKKGASSIKIDVTNSHPVFATVISFFKVAITFSLITLTWIFFRADTTGNAFGFIKGLFHKSYSTGYLNPYNNLPMTRENILIILFYLAEYIISNKEFACNLWKYKLVSIAATTTIIFFILTTIHLDVKQAFIYFQF